MATLNQLICSAAGGNTGLPSSCTHNPDLLIALIAIPRGTTFTATQLADFQATLQAGFINDTYANRYQLFGAFEAIENNSEERQEQTYGYGRQVVTRGARYNWDFTYLDGAMCAHQNYLKFKGRENQYDFLIVDKSRNIIGTTIQDVDTGEWLFKGIKLSKFYENDWMPKDGTNETVYMLSISVADTTQLNEYYGFVKVDFDVFDLDRVQDVVLNPLGAVSATGELNLGLNAGCGNQNLVEVYPAILNTGSIYLPTNELTGAAITVTSATVAGTSPNRYIILNMDDTDPDYPAAGQYISIDIAAPSVLAGLNLPYLDGIRVRVKAT